MVGDANFLEMNVGVEAFGMCFGEIVQEFLSITTVTDVIADVVSLFKSENDEVVAIAIVADGTGGGGESFLVITFPVNE